MKNLIRRILKEEVGSVGVNDKPTVIFIAGCSSAGECGRTYEYSHAEQGDLLKSALGNKFNVKTFSHVGGSSLTEISKHNDPYVIMFSAGGKHSESVTDTMISLNNDLKRVYIVEPYTCSEKTKRKVVNSISKGVPVENVFGGNSDCTGKNVAGTFRDYYGGDSHWDAISGVGSVVSKSYVEPEEITYKVTEPNYRTEEPSSTYVYNPYKLKEDLEYWRVSDASPNSDEYEMGIEEDHENIKRSLTQGKPWISKEDKQKSAYAKFIGEMAVKHSDIDEFSVKTSFGYRIPSFWFKDRYDLKIDRDFITRWYRYVADEFGIEDGDYKVIEGAMKVFFDRIFDMYGVEDETEDEDDSDPEELNEDVPIYKEHNLGKKMYERLRKAYPMTPEYVLKDYFFNNIVGNYDYIKKEHYGDPLLVTRGSWDSYLKGPWSLEVLTVNPEDFDDNTVDAFIRRDFGNEEMFTVDNDLKRTQIQRRLAKPTGMNEPVIVELKPNGKYELVEGWHRTMSILLLGDNGEDLKNWDKVKIRAFVRDLSK